MTAPQTACPREKCETQAQRHVWVTVTQGTHADHGPTGEMTVVDSNDESGRHPNAVG
jgi:hypothetical protein